MTTVDSISSLKETIQRRPLKARKPAEKPRVAAAPKSRAVLIISVRGGVVDVDKKSGRPCRIILRDYDIEGADPSALATRDGETYAEEVIDLA